MNALQSKATKLVGSMIFICFALGFAPVLAQEQTLPNIVLIFTDEMTAEYLGCYNGRYPTPNIDRLAREGMRFDNAFAAAAACTPSRYSVLTGHYPSRCNEVEFLKHNPTNRPCCISWNTHIDARTATIPRVLRTAGYVSSMSGKNHVATRQPWWDRLEQLGKAPGEKLSDPAVDTWLQQHQTALGKHIASQLGFDQAIAVIRGNNENNPLPALRHHNMAWISWGAANFLEKHDTTRPFFLFTTPTGIHGPWHGEEHTKDARYTPGGFNQAVDEHRLNPALVRERTEDLSSGEKHHTEGLMQIDHHVGRILDRLDALGLADNTLVVFTADHGVEPGKASVYRRGNRVPMIMRWPGRIPAGSSTKSLVAQVDLLATFAALAGGILPDTQVFDGVDLQPLWRNPSATVREVVYTEMGYGRAVFDGRYQLVRVRFPQEILDDLAAGKRELAPNHLGQNRSHANFTAAWFPGYFDQDQLYDTQLDPLLLCNRWFDTRLDESRQRLTHQLDAITASFDHPFPTERQAFLDSPEWLSLVQAAKRKGPPEPNWVARDHDRISWPPVR